MATKTTQTRRPKRAAAGDDAAVTVAAETETSNGEVKVSETTTQLKNLQKVEMDNSKKIDSNQETELDISELNAGIYFFKLASKNYFGFKKLVIEK